MKKKLQIFVSSTYTDLKVERQAAVEAILKSGNIPAGMELFTAGNESQLQTIMRWIDESDAYMLILGGRYGSIEPSSGNSYTEIEYDYAISQGKPIFASVISELALDEKVKLEGKNCLEVDNPDKLKKFREKVLSNISSFFNESKAIKLAIHETVQDFKDRIDFTGWVSGKEIENYEILQEELQQLRKENQILKIPASTDERLDSNRSTDKIEETPDFEELIEIFSEQTISTDIYSEGVSKEYTVIELIYGNRDTLVTGIHNSLSMTKTSKFLFFNLLPKLAVHDLAENEKVANATYRRFALNAKGRKLLAYLEKKIIQKKKQGKN